MRRGSRHPSNGRRNPFQPYICAFPERAHWKKGVTENRRNGKSVCSLFLKGNQSRTDRTSHRSPLPAVHPPSSSSPRDESQTGRFPLRVLMEELALIRMRAFAPYVRGKRSRMERTSTNERMPRRIHVMPNETGRESCIAKASQKIRYVHVYGGCMQLFIVTLERIPVGMFSKSVAPLASASVVLFVLSLLSSYHYGSPLRYGRLR